MIVLLSCSTNLSSRVYCQTSFTGGQDSIYIAVDDIRKANSKLIELQYEKDINNSLREYIRNDSIIIKQAREERTLLHRKSSKLTKERNIAVSSSILLLLLLIMKLL